MGNIVDNLEYTKTSLAGTANCVKCGKFVGKDYLLFTDHEDIYDQTIYCGKCANKYYGESK